MEKEDIQAEAGLGRNEGIVALLSYIGFFITAITGLRKKPVFIILVIALLGLFHAIYARRLCAVCKKLCPANPSGNFWKTYF